jgi:transposase
MSKNRQQYDEDFRKNVVKLSYATSKTIKALAKDLGIHSSLIYRWRKIYTEQGDKTKLAEQQDALRKLQIKKCRTQNGERNVKKSSGLTLQKI